MLKLLQQGGDHISRHEIRKLTVSHTSSNLPGIKASEQEVSIRSEGANNGAFVIPHTTVTMVTTITAMNFAMSDLKQIQVKFVKIQENRFKKDLRRAGASATTISFQSTGVDCGPTGC